jgi:SAM-dependent methyltransferase
MTAAFPEAMERFRKDYAKQRASEGRAYSGAELATLPYLDSGPLARQWAVRARTFDAFLRLAVRPLAKELRRPLGVLDLGAGNGWLSYRLAGEGHACTAIDIREDSVDGLGKASGLARRRFFTRLVASFEALPLPDACADVAAFNAALHYSTDLQQALSEAVRCVRKGGLIAILDSPFYRRAADGAAMVAEKRRLATQRFEGRAASLLALPHVEYVTRESLREASQPLGLAWARHRVRYPLWYELRPVAAFARGARAPSRFDLWTARVR